jgi:hypothetical protein
VGVTGVSQLQPMHTCDLTEEQQRVDRAQHTRASGFDEWLGVRLAGAWTQQGVAAKLQQRVMELVDSPSWEGRQGGFLAAKVRPLQSSPRRCGVLALVRIDGHAHVARRSTLARNTASVCLQTLVPYHDTDSPFLERLLTECENHLEDEEARVRCGPYDCGCEYAAVHLREASAGVSVQLMQLSPTAGWLWRSCSVSWQPRAARPSIFDSNGEPGGTRSVHVRIRCRR